MLVNYYYIFGLKKALATALFLQKTLRLIHNQHKPNILNQEAPVLLELFFLLWVVKLKFSWWGICQHKLNDFGNNLRASP